MSEQLSEEAAIAFYDSGKWRDMTDRERVAFQLYQDCLAMPFGEFHLAVERVLGRPVWTHEFARPENLRREFEGRQEPLDPMDSLRQIIGDKPVLVIDPNA